MVRFCAGTILASMRSLGDILRMCRHESFVTHKCTGLGAHDLTIGCRMSLVLLEDFVIFLWVRSGACVFKFTAVNAI